MLLIIRIIPLKSCSCKGILGGGESSVVELNFFDVEIGKGNIG